jgi:glycosyltransferase involved in cell wall biosynthesis
MKILLSAYACEPNKGSEPAVGWNWALEVARLGHRVWVLTRANNQSSIESMKLSSPEKNNLQFLYYDLPRWANWWKKGHKGVHLYYFLWQLGAYRYVNKIHKKVAFHIVHHVTFASIRQPSFMGNLGVPFIFGPAGGGERTPWLLRYSYGIKGRINDLIRDIANFMIKVDPFMWKTFYQADRIYVTSDQTMALLPKRFRIKAIVRLAVGTERPKNLIARRKKLPIRILYVGRFLYWKGMQIGIYSFAKLLESVPDSFLTLVGEGPEKEKWKILAITLGIEKKIDWVPWIEHGELQNIYRQNNIFLFPSLHDSGGQVVLEAMANGLPVVCFDAGGPGKIVNKTCGLKVPVHGIKAEQIIDLIAKALIKIAKDRSLLSRLSSGALGRVKDFTWASTIKEIYGNKRIESYNIHS